MMGALESTLASIPGYGGYLAKRQYDQQQEAGQMQQMGALVGLHQHLQQQEQEKQFRAELGALGENPDQTALTALAAKYSKPGEVLKSQQSSLDRQATVEAARLNSQAVREQRAADLQTKLADTKLGREERNAIMLEIAKLRTDASQNKPPPGYRHLPNGNLEAIPGGPADLKIVGQFNQDTASLAGTSASLDRLANAANELLNHPGLGGITGIRGAIPNVPGSAAANAEAKLTTLKAQVGFGVLQDMKNASKTGGALGSVTEGEHKLLQNALEGLDKAQSKEQMAQSLAGIMKYAEAAKERLRGAYNLKHPGGVPAPAPGGSAPVVPAAVSPGSSQGAPAPAAGAPAPTPASPAPGAFQEGQTATGPNGQKIMFKGGQWQPATSQ